MSKAARLSGQWVATDMAVLVVNDTGVVSGPCRVGGLQLRLPVPKSIQVRLLDERRHGLFVRW